MAMVCQLNKLDHEKLGFIPHLDLVDFAYDLDDDLQGLVGARYSFIGSDGLRRTVVIEKVLYRAEGIIGRCSIAVEVRCICSVSGCNWDGENKIMKISLLTRSRTSEEPNRPGNHWALNHLPNIIDSITVTYDETRTVQGRLKAHLKEKYEERVMLHQWLYECAGILHRDLSIGNIMFRRIDGKVYGVLNDFDLSFISLFFIMICLACRYERPVVPAAEPRTFSKWFTGGTDDEPLPIQPYFAGFRDWLDAIYHWLCTAYQGRPHIRHLPKLLPARVQNPQSQNNFSSRNTPYDWNTLGGIFTYADMVQLMSSFQDQPLETQWAGANPDH
ncbi:protein kinase [Lentinula detonsa]|uniref:Protein kinase n=1 Tax=Lentinula detonsa TaxID=2804962 RepID=A0AA38Q397_9AGAR|nr:protein kinase [Lentinula detonsa]